MNTDNTRNVIFFKSWAQQNKMTFYYTTLPFNVNSDFPLFLNQKQNPLLQAI